MKFGKKKYIHRIARGKIS